MRELLLEYLDSFLSLFYPRLCLVCGYNLPVRQQDICISCQYKLPKTGFHLERENGFTERFWGRVPIHAGAAMYFFNKAGRTQQLIHRLKYDNKPEVGIRIGNIYGKLLLESPYFQDIDIILPIPLHIRRKRERGYNQSDQFALGLSEGMERPWRSNILERVHQTSSQTKKSRLERFANVEQVFRVKKPDLLRGKHILLVDDVLTTGATLESCALEILKIPDTKVSMVTIAIAE